ncbi:hypothetical protein HanPSC8_Chr17g0761991 [Helianthus annuus]|nr:hypothetical protein HanPSC8_Chr17g0761991 [Helianthus annuus]
MQKNRISRFVVIVFLGNESILDFWEKFRGEDTKGTTNIIKKSFYL